MKLKLFVLAVYLAGMVRSVPVIENGPPVPVMSFNHSDPFSLAIKESIFLADDNDLNYRLPNNSLPVHYDLWLKTDVDQEIFDFEGNVKIRIIITASTDIITLHYRQITIEQVNLLNVVGDPQISNLVTAYEETREFFNINLPRVYNVDEEFILEIIYNAVLRTDSSGFYRASYVDNASGNPVWFATTQFEMTDARHAMPCFDEPGIRATTSLRIQHGSRYNAISNMPVSSRDEIAGTNYVTTTFQDTPKMQTYLLAFIISDYQFVSNNDSITEQRVYADPQRIARGDAAFPITAVGPVLRTLEEVLGVIYPLPKMDHAAVTDYIWGAMENFGLITYRDSGLLFVEGTDDESRKINIIELIAHEYAHQWFGNTISPKWWAFIWLNEAFATLFSYYVPELAFPENNHWGRFVNAQNAAFNIDTQSNNAVPLNYYVQTPDDIRNKFSTISYQKGGSVLRMFMEAMTIPTFLKGLNYYLNEMYYESATPDDLHRNLQKAYDEDFPEADILWGETMATWEDQAGYPNIHVTKSLGQFTLVQSRVGGGGEIYSIPVSYTTKTEGDFETTTVKHWLTTSSSTITTPADWIILNIQSTGYYKVSYDNSIWTTFVETLNDDHTIISEYHRLQLLVDYRTILNADTAVSTHGLDILQYLKKENAPAVWAEARNIANFYLRNLFGTGEVYSKYLEYLRSLTEDHLTRLGFDTIIGEAETDTLLRSWVTDLSCTAFDSVCLNYENQRLSNFLLTGTGGSPDICKGIRNADQALFSTAVTRMFEQSTSAERFPYIINLGCSLNTELLRTFLELTLDSSNVLMSDERRELIISTFGKSEIGFATAIDFLKENFVALEAIAPIEFRTILAQLAVYINSPEQLENLVELLDLIVAEEILPSEFTFTVIEQANAQKEWIQVNAEQIYPYFGLIAPTPVPTENPVTGNPTVPVTTTTTQSTPSSSSSVIASFTFVAACAVVKMFV